MKKEEIAYQEVAAHIAKKIEIFYTCDKCGKPCGDDEETRSCYDVSKAQIFKLEGDQFPEGRFVERTEIDCCVQCFDEFVVPALAALGFKTRTEDDGW